MFEDIDLVIYTFLGLEIFGAFERAGCGKNADYAGAGAERGRFDRRFHPDKADMVMPASSQFLNSVAHLLRRSIRIL